MVKTFCECVLLLRWEQEEIKLQNVGPWWLFEVEITISFYFIFFLLVYKELSIFALTIQWFECNDSIYFYWIDVSKQFNKIRFPVHSERFFLPSNSNLPRAHLESMHRYGIWKNSIGTFSLWCCGAFRCQRKAKMSFWSQSLFNCMYSASTTKNNATKSIGWAHGSFFCYFFVHKNEWLVFIFYARCDNVHVDC